MGPGFLLNIEHDRFVAYTVIIITYLIVFIFYHDSTKSFTDRSRWNNFRIAIVTNGIMAVLLVLTLYLLHVGNDFSRGFFIYFFAADTVLMFLFDEVLRNSAKAYFKKHARQMVVFANPENVNKVLFNLTNHAMDSFDIRGIAVMSKNRTEFYRILRRKDNGHSYIDDNYQTLDEFLLEDIVDVALISLPNSRDYDAVNIIQRLEIMGIICYLTLNTFDLGIKEAGVEQLGPYHVLEYAPKVFPDRDLFLKRILDIVGGIVGCILCFIIGIFVVPAIYIEDPGPVIFKQKRVGRNGRFFYMYKFRSMYQDAEERKKELMAQNEMNGLMFKMENDPRITKVGGFIRKTSLDEFPQFFNVLKGDMSLVGTRPPTVDEFRQYDAHHKRRLSLKPGITGLWQVSGRSDITDFEEVVRLDVEYIDNWSFNNDIKILFKTVKQIFKPEGSR